MQLVEYKKFKDVTFDSKFDFFFFFFTIFWYFLD